MNILMDLGMVSALVICYLSIKWFIDWCGQQIEKP